MRKRMALLVCIDVRVDGDTGASWRSPRGEDDPYRGEAIRVLRRTMVRLKKGETVKLHFVSEDVVHGMYVKPLKIDTDIQPGEWYGGDGDADAGGQVHGDLRPLLWCGTRQHEDDVHRGRVASGRKISLSAPAVVVNYVKKFRIRRAGGSAIRTAIQLRLLVGARPR